MGLVFRLSYSLIMTEFQACSLNFLPDDLNKHELNGDEIRVHRFVLEGWLQREGVAEDKPLLVHLTNTLGITRICCVGGPHFQDRNKVYIPHWIMEQIGIEQDSQIHIEPLVEDIPYATMIYLKPMDTAIYHTDIRECFEKALDMFHVIETGTMLSVEIESLGGYKVEAYVDKLEPGFVGRLGGEVGVEFLEPEGGVPEFTRQSTPPPPVINEPVLTPVNENTATENTVVDYVKIREEVRASWLKKFKKD
jgi:hypothetical protein